MQNKVSWRESTHSKTARKKGRTCLTAGYCNREKATGNVICTAASLLQQVLMGAGLGTLAQYKPNDPVLLQAKWVMTDVTPSEMELGFPVSTTVPPGGTQLPSSMACAELVGLGPQGSVFRVKDQTCTSQNQKH